MHATLQLLKDFPSKILKEAAKMPNNITVDSLTSREDSFMQILLLMYSQVV